MSVLPSKEFSLHLIMITIKKHIFLFLALLSVISCESPSTLTKRAETALKNDELKNDIVIGIVATSTTPDFFLEGVKLALEELNQQGGVLGRKISPLFYDDEGDIEKGLDLSEKIADNLNIIAVVGHRYSDVAIPASITYEENGIVFISHGATNSGLTKYSGAFTFRNIPSDEDIGKEAARFAHRRGLKKMLIFYDRDTSGKRLAEIFDENATALGIEIVARKSYFSWQEDIPLLISDITKEYIFDGIFLGGVLPSGATVIKQMRDMGITVPILGTDLFDSPVLQSIAGRAAEGTIVSTVFDPKEPVNLTQNFVKTFKKKYGVLPDTWAAQGYDAIQLLAFAMEKSGSPVPVTISTTLRSLGNWEGVTGSYSLTSDGDIAGKSIFFKEFRNGSFEMLEREPRDNKGRFDLVESITLRLPVEGIIPTIDPGLTVDVTSIEITEQLFLGLTDYNPDNYEAVPELAHSWTVSEDGKTYRFQMRKDAFWTNGEPVTAHDVVWAIQRNIRPETKSPYAFMLYILKNAEAINTGDNTKDISELGVRAVDGYTVEFTLEYPAGYFPAMAGLWIYRPVHKKTVEKYRDNWTDPWYIQTSGSYRLAAWERGKLMILRKNPNYYEHKNVSVQEVRYYVIQESSVGLAMYENNELDIMGSTYLRLPLADIPRIKSDIRTGKEYSSKPQFCTYAYGFNTKLPPVDDPLVRKAISAAIDRELLIKIVTMGGEEPATTFTRPPVFGAVNPGEGAGISFNPEQAKKWLAQAGYPGGRGFPEITILYNISETHEKIAKAVRSFLKHYLNINVRLEARKWEDYMEYREQPTTPHMYREGWCGDYPDANNWLNEVFHPFKSANRIGWDNTEFAELMNKAREATEPEQRKTMYRRAEELLCEQECAVVPIYFETSHCLVKPRVKGWYHMAMGGQHIRNWRLEE